MTPEDLVRFNKLSMRVNTLETNYGWLKKTTIGTLLVMGSVATTISLVGIPALMDISRGVVKVNSSMSAQKVLIETSNKEVKYIRDRLDKYVDGDG